MSEIFRRSVGEVISRRLDGVEVHPGRQIDEMVQGHGRLGLDVQGQILAEAVGGNA